MNLVLALSSLVLVGTSVIKFGFSPGGDLHEQARNWLIMNSKVKGEEYDPFATIDFVGEGWTGVDNYWGTYATFGPIVYFQISIISDTVITWINGSRTFLPIAIARRSGSDTQQYGLSFPVTTPTGLVDNGFGQMQTFGTNQGTMLAAGTDEVTGIPEMNISGWYYR